MCSLDSPFSIPPCFPVHSCADQAVTFSQQLEEEIRLKVGSMHEDLSNGGGEAAEGRRPSGRGTLWFFPVDNTIGNMDPVMEEIQQVVLERVKKERYVNEKVPFAWLRVLEQL